MALDQEVIKMKNRGNKKWTNNIWFIRIIALVFSIFLYTFVGAENNRFAARSPNASINITETVSNVPVQLGQVGDDVFVSNLQESVSLRITGPKNIVTQVLAKDLYVETEDLRNFEMGRQQVRLKMPTALAEAGVEYQITPSRVIVDLNRLASRQVEVNYEIADNLIAEGYELVNVTMDTSSVTLTGNESTIESIDRVFVRISSDKPQTSTFTKSFPIEIRDNANNLLDLNADISKTNVTVEIRKLADPEATVSLSVVGENLENYQYEYVLVGPQQVTLDGDAALIASIGRVNAVLDVSEITESGTYPATIQMPEGLNGISPQTVDVQVTVTPKVVESQSEESSQASSSVSAEESVLPAEESVTNEVESNTDENTSAVSEEQVN